MKRSLFACVGLMAMGASALAADVHRRYPYPPPEPPPAYVPAFYKWTGFYLGINGGAGWGSSHWDFPGGSTGDFGLSGGLFGLTAGYNFFHAGPAVMGIEGDVNLTNIRGDSNGLGCGVLNCSTRNTWLSTVRGRLGYVGWNTFMPYVTGGLAFGNIKANFNGLPEQTSEQIGWTLGAGIETSFYGPWTAKVEYLHVDLGSFSCGGAACGVPGPANVHFSTDILRAGLNFRFNN
jgi:outer membrane immunogenic protein